uniref:6-phosphogluconate dehydrogenase, decarboxylating n=1 Tax=Xenopus laevis TaxID=8355 RepID=Q498C6_XENLA|nr:uncharacterized protein LOC735164 [Xenopus laevis]AAI00273.1 MGC116449 protein [Xenopus laevis]
MGQNLALNFASHQIKCSVYNRSPDKVDQTVQRGEKEGCKDYVFGYKDLSAFIDSLVKPRKIIMMVTAGNAVDSSIEKISEYIDDGDILIDGGNEWYENTQRRAKAAADDGYHYIGMGVSGGEIGARYGPSLMPGGPSEVYNELKPLLSKISAQVGDSSCVSYFIGAGSGNYVKMVHNGIEYADMQLISEAYDLLKLYGLTNEEMYKIFNDWNQGELASYLIEITAKILIKEDKDVEGCEPKSGYLLDKILDCTHNKGTGMWTVQAAASEQVSVPTIADALFMRYLSERKSDRVFASTILKGPTFDFKTINKQQFIEDVKNALYCSKICAYAQGFQLINQAAIKFKWEIDLKECARIWKGGCIIRAKLLDKIMLAYEKNSNLPLLLFDNNITNDINIRQESWRRIVTLSIASGYTVSGISASLGYYDNYRRARLPHNLLQAQRDYFGSHKFERIDRNEGEFFHCKWTSEHA